MSWVLPSDGQSIGASASVLPVNIQGWSPLGWTGWISLQSKGLLSLLQHHSSKASILWRSAFMVQFSHLYMTNGRTMALARWTFVSKVMSLLFNIPSRLVIAFPPRSKCLYFHGCTDCLQWLWSPENKVCHCFHFSPFYLPWSDGTRCHYLSFLNVEFQARFFTLLFYLLDKRGSVVPLSAHIICISEVVDVSPRDLSSCLCFIQPRISHDVLCIEVK